MIKIKIKNNIIKISGHANYSEFGNDIVCASVSSIILTTVNSIMNIEKSSIDYNDDGKVITIINNQTNKNTDILINTMIELLKDLEKKYKKNIKIESEE